MNTHIRNILIDPDQVMQTEYIAIYDVVKPYEEDPEMVKGHPDRVSRLGAPVTCGSG